MSQTELREPPPAELQAAEERHQMHNQQTPATHLHVTAAPVVNAHPIVSLDRYWTFAEREYGVNLATFLTWSAGKRRRFALRLYRDLYGSLETQSRIDRVVSAHPDLPVNEAVAAGILSADDAELLERVMQRLDAT